MAGHGTVAGFATHTHFCHSRPITIAGRVIMLAKSCVMTSGAHRVPGHASSCPMAPFTWFPILLAEYVEPFGNGGGESQLGALKPAARTWDQKLPQWINPDDSDRNELLSGIGSAGGGNNEMVVAKGGRRVLGARGDLISFRKSGVVEAEAHRPFCNRMMRGLPNIENFFMTGSAILGTAIRTENHRIRLCYGRARLWPGSRTLMPKNDNTQS